MPSPQQARQQEKRDQKLKDIQDQVDQGTLVIRQMTVEERERYPPRPADAPGRRPRRRA